MRKPRFGLWQTVRHRGEKRVVIAIQASSNESDYLVEYTVADDGPAPYYAGCGHPAHAKEADLQTEEEWLTSERERVKREAAALGLTVVEEAARA